MKKIILLAVVFTLAFIGCKSDKGKLTGKWKDDYAILQDPEMKQMEAEASEKSKECGGCSAAQSIVDSITKITTEEDNLYGKGGYQFNDDGSVVVTRGDNKEIKGTWKIENGKDYTYVVLTGTDGKLIERWFVDPVMFKGDIDRLTFNMLTVDGALDVEKGSFISMNITKEK